MARFRVYSTFPSKVTGSLFIFIMSKFIFWYHRYHNGCHTQTTLSITQSGFASIVHEIIDLGGLPPNGSRINLQPDVFRDVKFLDQKYNLFDLKIFGDPSVFCRETNERRRSENKSSKRSQFRVRSKMIKRISLELRPPNSR